MGIGTIPVAGIVLVIGGFILVSLLVRTFPIEWTDGDSGCGDVRLRVGYTVRSLFS